MPSADIRTAVERVATFLRENPDQARYVDKPATAVVEEGLRCRATGPDGATLVSDMPRALGGGAAAPSPGWLLRACLANCDATMIALRAAQLGVTLTALEVTVESESDDRGLLGLDDDIPAGPLRFFTRVRIAAAGADAARLHEIVAWAEAHSPIADVLRRVVPTGVEVEGA